MYISNTEYHQKKPHFFFLNETRSARSRVTPIGQASAEEIKVPVPTKRRRRERGGEEEKKGEERIEGEGEEGF